MKNDSCLRLSLAEWSLHLALESGSLDHLDFPRVTRGKFDIDAIELVNTFFQRGTEPGYLQEFKRRADDAGVQSLLIMCDHEGDLGDPDEKARQLATANHWKWVEAARFLGCHSIRVNARSNGSPEEQLKRFAEGLHPLCERAAAWGINVLIENHGGLSSNAAWLVSVIRAINLPNCGTLPDLGNFKISETEQYDRYLGVAEMMPFAKGVSAKTHEFTAQGEETEIDYRRMLQIVLDSGYRGYLGIEYGGKLLPEPEGIAATRRLIERVTGELRPGHLKVAGEL